MGNAALGASDLGMARYAFQQAYELNPRLSSKAKHIVDQSRFQNGLEPKEIYQLLIVSFLVFISQFAEQILLGALFFTLALFTFFVKSNKRICCRLNHSMVEFGQLLLFYNTKAHILVYPI